MTRRAVAVDLGASSVRFAEGVLEGGRITYSVIRQVANEPIESEGGPAWNVDTLLGICKDAEAHAIALDGATLGIDSWGVDHGFVGPDGELLQPPICYRHPLHGQLFEELRLLRSRLYELTGIQHQPFNTFYQLVARGRQRPDLKATGNRWLILPELMGHLLGAPAGHELTQASTTQLLGLDGDWSREAFELADWPVPEQAPELPAKVIGDTKNGVPLARVGSHDTASAVCGLGTLAPHQAFLNAGTWSLLGVVLDQPLANRETEAANLTNERGADGRVRFLDNIPGFFVINRLHVELGVTEPVSEWLKTADLSADSRIDLFDPSLFSPDSMLEAVSAQLANSGQAPIQNPESKIQHSVSPIQNPNSKIQNPTWAGIALLSLVDATIHKLEDVERLTGRRTTEIRVAGGGSASEPFCRQLAERSGRAVIAGPQEATVLGNLGVQFLAQGAFGSFEEMAQAIDASLDLRRYEA